MKRTATVIIVLLMVFSLCSCGNNNAGKPEKPLETARPEFTAEPEDTAGPTDTLPPEDTAPEDTAPEDTAPEDVSDDTVELQELGEDPISFTFDNEYTVENIIVHISEIQVRQRPFKTGSHVLEFRIFCDLTNTASSDQFFTATKTGNIVGVFYGEEETDIGGTTYSTWDNDGYNIGTGMTVPAGGTEELVVQASTIILDTITMDDELVFDIYFRNNDYLYTVTFSCIP